MGIRRHISNQALLPFTLLNNNGRFADRWMLLERVLDFLKLDSVSTDLYLLVGAAEELDAAIRQVPCEITGLVESFARRFGEDLGDEFLGGQIRSSEVAAAYLDAADMKLARNAYGYAMPRGMDQLNLGVRYRAAEPNPPQQICSPAPRASILI